MDDPKTDHSTRVRIVSGKGGTTINGNRAAFRTMARWMTLRAESNPKEHRECHLCWHMQSHFGRVPRVNVEVGRNRQKSELFEVTFTVARPDELKARRRRQRKKKPVGKSA